MTQLFVYAEDSALADAIVEQISSAGHAQVYTLQSPKLAARQPKENKYLFVCQTPAAKLTELAPQTKDQADFAQNLGSYYDSQSQILASYKTNKKNALLITVSQWLQNPPDILNKINAHWQLQLAAPPITGNNEQPDPLLGYLVQNLVEKTAVLAQLASEIETLTAEQLASYHEVDAIVGYRNLQETGKKVTKKIQQDLKDHEEENELLLSQLMEVQEELERIYLEGQADKEVLSQKLKELEELSVSKEAQEHIAKEREKELNRLKEDLKALHALELEKETGLKLAAALEEEIQGYKVNAKELQSDIQLKATLINALEDEYSSLKENTGELATQNATQQKEIEALNTANEAQTERLSTTEAQIEALNTANKAQSARLSAAEEEITERLKLLQESHTELEKYFIELQEVRIKLDQANQRWERVLHRNQTLIDYRSADIATVDKKTHTFKWMIKELEGNILKTDLLEFETFIEAGVLGIRFNKTNSLGSPNLKQWPQSANDVNTIECIPAGKGDAKKLRAAILKELTTSDWALLNMLPKLILQELDKTQLKDETATYKEASIKLLQGLKNLPQTLRYDSVALKNNQVNPDYEHLWFVFENATFGERHWPKFEFRLGAANIEKNGFTNHPKLEFPLIDGKIKPFESWYPESKDGFGKKLELRFDLKNKIFDNEVWGKIEGEDKWVVKSCIETLHFAVKASKQLDFNIERDINSWVGVARDCAFLFKTVDANK